MPISFNGNTPSIITFNNQPVSALYYNGTLVWPTSTPLTYTYTGTSSEKNITYNGVTYKLLTLTTNGTLTFNKRVSVDIWACGGGSNGLNYSSAAGPGGAGAYCNELDNKTVTTLNVVIGPANTASGTIISGDASLTALGVSNTYNGGTGGGAAFSAPDSYIRGYGDGKSKYPFGDTTNFDPHCAGGGGGGLYFNGWWWNGGFGGTNGGNGEAGEGKSSTFYWKGGGRKGGGTGGGNDRGTAATFYGSGGGGCGNKEGGIVKYGGNGYQGVCYIRIPISEFA